MRKAKPKQTKEPIRPIWWDRPARPMSKKWKCWCAEGFIRMVDGCRRRDALETLTITRDMLPRRGRVKYDWSTDDQWRHP
jgi:hypothetical protein